MVTGAIALTCRGYNSIYNCLGPPCRFYSFNFRGRVSSILKRISKFNGVGFNHHVYSALSPVIMVQWKMAGYLKGNDPIGDTSIFH